MSPSCQVFLELRNMFSFVEIAVFDEILRFGKIFSDGRSPILIEPTNVGSGLMYYSV